MFVDTLGNKLAKEDEPPTSVRDYVSTKLGRIKFFSDKQIMGNIDLIAPMSVMAVGISVLSHLCSDDTNLTPVDELRLIVVTQYDSVIFG
jgi:hypothetical protein